MSMATSRNYRFQPHHGSDLSPNAIPRQLTKEFESENERYPWKVPAIHEYSSPNRTTRKQVVIMEPKKRSSPTSVFHFNVQAEATSPPSKLDFDKSFALLEDGRDPFETVPSPYKPQRVPSQHAGKSRRVPRTDYPATISILTRPSTSEQRSKSTIEVLEKISESKSGDSVSIYSEGLDNFSVPMEKEQAVPPVQFQMPTICEPTAEVQFEQPANRFHFQKQERGIEPSGKVNRSFSYISDASETSFDERDRKDAKDDASVSSSVILNRHDITVAALSLQVDDYSEETYQRILGDLRGNPQIKTLDVFRRDVGDHNRIRTYEDIFLLFNILGGIPSLKVLQLHNFEADEIAYLDDLMDQSNKLSTMTIRVYALNL